MAMPELISQHCDWLRILPFRGIRREQTAAKQSAAKQSAAKQSPARPGAAKQTAAEHSPAEQSAAMRRPATQSPAEQTSAKRFHHEVKLTLPAEVDAELVKWLKDAYALSG